ncbi:hypothetical protein [Kineosporia sp. A_224]|uniref:hypothetical protein n=1 Tax=Kineosporia sp. A_224 TaxID=1962180 RepID=UPI000B4A8E3E|nr:hypothetical protein [Kineosporia sp. A_224]
MTHQGDDGTTGVGASSGYAAAQLTTAFVTALTHEDPAVRTRAEHRARQWGKVLSGMLTGTLRIGSRTPVEGLPAWVTPTVVRGGFATGDPAAGGPLEPDEVATAAAAGVPATRLDLFRHHLGPAGLADLAALLDAGTYRVTVPEEAVLLTVAWLVDAGDVAGAQTLVTTVAPFADRLRFLPRPAARPAPAPEVVWRATAGETAATLRARRPNPRVEAMREALEVWAPFGDDLLTLWLETVDGGRVAALVPDGWGDRAAALLDRYRALAAEHRLCRKHLNPKENLATLRSALVGAVEGHPLTARDRGRLQTAVDGMLAKRGVPGTDRHATLREVQAGVVALPTHDVLARAVADRVREHPADTGIYAPDALLAPVDGHPVPAGVERTVRRSTAATVERLVALGVVPSSEVLAGLVPQITAGVLAESWTDPRLRTLVAAAYGAFRHRRSLLLLDLARQVGFGELPWVAALAPHRTAGGAADVQRRTAVRVAGLALTAFPGTILPNPLVAELDTLLRAAGVDLPLTEELAADIFMGAFSAKFSRAAKLAAEVLAGTPYARYYGIDTDALLALSDGVSAVRGPHRGGLALLAAQRAGVDVDGRGWWSVATNGTVVEQAQVLTTHNLAALVAGLGVRPENGWEPLAQEAFGRVVTLVGRLPGDKRPLPTVKDAAYAWRQTLFFLSVSPAGATDRFLDLAGSQVAARPDVDRRRLLPLLAGLRGARSAPAHDEPHRRGVRVTRAAIPERFLGWSTDGHWMLRTP